MKRFIAILSMCLVLVAAGISNAQAQKGKAAKKVIELISKGAKKTPKKAPAVKPKAPAKQVKPRPRTTKTVTCSQCNGHGTVTYWNSYYGQYQTATCSKCNGSGKVRQN
ncbi:MAG: hypothetical protein HDS71_08875 [Bacteroidales bacterium]|nr:hypothetical protein [Bacteroidales bacterium]MBD5205182.1 hypothetical protein [Bacteroidales bacterium]MBD5224137.1 hypothetical protein [Bacteroidales bacterium]